MMHLASPRWCNTSCFSSVKCSCDLGQCPADSRCYLVLLLLLGKLAYWEPRDLCQLYLRPNVLPHFLFSDVLILLPCMMFCFVLFSPFLAWSVVKSGPHPFILGSRSITLGKHYIFSKKKILITLEFKCLTHQQIVLILLLQTRPYISLFYIP